MGTVERRTYIVQGTATHLRNPWKISEVAQAPEQPLGCRQWATYAEDSEDEGTKDPTGPY